jgi:hypothetical protein
MEALRYSAPAGLTIQAESPTNGVGVAADTFESLARMNSQSKGDTEGILAHRALATSHKGKSRVNAPVVTDPAS